MVFMECIYEGDIDDSRIKKSEPCPTNNITGKHMMTIPIP